MSLMLGGPFWIVCVVCVVISFICFHFDITSRTALPCSAGILDKRSRFSKLIFINEN
jgi:hypothetical protein